MSEKQTPKYTTIYSSDNGKFSVQNYILSLVDKTSREKKNIEMVRINKVSNKFIEGYGYQDITRYMDVSAQAFKNMLDSFSTK